ncbi:hypothetical protein Aph01nite_43540 [Acrocarpospora phusangensis]|uniref:Uncharacterized protein n=1 Tax=Acrocarpospora phusangensis TaxID=1070424 RepID=A0A919ULJ3_9ACTN|nr:hypothetical protein [Acrocarpospora phusangensis]GIH26044.1 hypothetical protein Aph01nite_43540 [Acrocarpospora phusangensis]
MSRTYRASRRMNGEQRAERAAQAYELRLQGLTIAVIARELDLAGSTVHELLTEYSAARLDPLTDEYRRIELDRLDDYTAKAYEVLVAEHVLVQHGKVIYDPETEAPMRDLAPKLAAIDRLVRISERRSRLLGLDAVIKADVTVTPVDPTDLALMQLVTEARAKTAVEEARLKGEGA